MGEWKKTMLGEECKMRRGASPRPIDNPAFFSDEGRGWIRISDLAHANKYLFETTQYLSKHGEQFSVAVEPNDLIVSICATIGKPIILGIKACIHDGFVFFYDTGNNSKEFLYYLLQYNQEAIISCKQTGTQGNLNTDILREFKIFIPLNPQEQNKIAEILSTVDTVIEKTKALIEKYKSIKEGMLQDLLTNGIDKDGNIRSPETHEYKDSPLGEIPAEWECINIDSAFKLRARIGWQGLKAAEFTDNGPVVVTGTDFENGKIDWDRCYHISEKRYKQDKGIQLHEGDLVITKDGTIGKTAFIDNCPTEVTLNSGVFVIRPFNNKVLTKFLYYVLNSNIFELFMKNMLTGSTIKHLNQEAFYKMKFLIPCDIKEQDQIINILNVVDNKIIIEQKQLKKYESIKKGLMQDLLTYKIPVDCLL